MQDSAGRAPHVGVGGEHQAPALRSRRQIAIVQADVYQAFLDRAEEGNGEAVAMIRPLRVILPLYNPEIHYIVRADSPLVYLHDIKDARINGGLVGSGAALITHTLYRMMFNGPSRKRTRATSRTEEALVKLITDRSVDVVVVAAGQPAPLIANMNPRRRSSSSCSSSIPRIRRASFR